MSNAVLSRRQFLAGAGLAALGWVASSCRAQTVPHRALRIAHLTDMHVIPTATASEGFARALRHAQGQADKPDMILNTGDSVMETLGASKEDAQAQWDAFRTVLTQEVSIPSFHAIGNHDVWGWALGDLAPKRDPLFGKGMAVAQLGLSNRYYSFDRGGWHFVVLDSTHEPNAVSAHPYIGKLDEEQFAWLVREVEAVAADTPICIVSHIPVLAACEYLDGPNEESGNWVIPAAWMHIDARRLYALFLAHPNIRLCLSGHSHQREELRYHGVTYLTDGAVCGNWWNGDYMHFPPAYVLVDLFTDGSVESTFVPYDA